jgi:biopolymer transport protein ExbD
MKSRVQTRRAGALEPGINLTPMLDMIFNLLFFFVLATNIRDESTRMDIRLPSAASAARETSEEKPLSITVNAEGRVFFKDRPMVKEELELELRHLIQKGRHEVAIRGDERVDYGRVIEVMDWCKLAGMKSVILTLGKPAGQFHIPKE